MDAPSLPKERHVVKGQERTFDMMQALRKKLWESGVRDEAEQNDFINKYIVAPESRMESLHPGGGAPVAYKYTISNGGNRVTFQSMSRLRHKLPTVLKEWRSGQQSDHGPAELAAGKHTSGSGDNHIALSEDEPHFEAEAADNSDASTVASTEHINNGAGNAVDTITGKTAPPATGVAPSAGRMPGTAAQEGLLQTAGNNTAAAVVPTPDKGPRPADLAGVLVPPGAKRQRVERAPAESIIGSTSTSILAQVDRSLLQNSDFLNVMAKLIENERVDKDIELRRISLKEKQLDVCNLVMSDNAEELMTAMASHKQQSLLAPAAAAAAAAHGAQN